MNNPLTPFYCEGGSPSGSKIIAMAMAGGLLYRLIVTPDFDYQGAAIFLAAIASVLAVKKWGDNGRPEA